MKLKQQIALISVIIVFLQFTNCSEDEVKIGSSEKLDTLTFFHQMKGYELYSWPEGNSWKYSFLIGTNRIKTLPEVISNKIAVLGTDSLKLLLDKFPAEEHLFWIGPKWLQSCWRGNFGNLGLPDVNTQNEIKAYCQQKKLDLVLSDNISK